MGASAARTGSTVETSEHTPLLRACRGERASILRSRILLAYADWLQTEIVARLDPASAGAGRKYDAYAATSIIGLDVHLPKPLHGWRAFAGEANCPLAVA